MRAGLARYFPAAAAIEATVTIAATPSATPPATITRKQRFTVLFSTP